jgi:hypothetical protein
MESYRVKRGDTLGDIARRFGLNLPKLIRANRQIRNPDRILIGQVILLPLTARHGSPTTAPGGPTVGAVVGKDAVEVGGNPAASPKYLQNAIAAVGIPIWGGSFELYKKVVNGAGTNGISLQRSEVPLANDPLRMSSFEIRVVYATRDAANSAVTAWNKPGAYAYYVGIGDLIFPTIISDTTAPALCDALRKAVEQERKDAQAAEKTSIALLLWYVGARFPPTVGAPTSKVAAAGQGALAGFSSVERSVITETRTILSSPEMGQLRQAQAAGREIVVRVGGRLIQYEPGLQASGMTMFGENGFLIGREAFASEAELAKTLLHELYRLKTSVIGPSGVFAGEVVAVETKAAFDFAERAYDAVFAAQ